MVIKSLYKDYFQKSRVFLYPALDIKRGVSVTPIETYMAWEDHYPIDAAKFICLYHLRDDEFFKQFEKVKLLGNKFYHDFKQVEEKKGVYVFDFDSMLEDWFYITNGKYSKISNDFKLKIRHYIGVNSPNLPYVESFLYPERFFKLYAEMMGVEEKVLRDVGELCSKPEVNKETLNISVLNLELTDKI